MTTFAVIANVSLIAFICVVIVGMLAWAIHTSRVQPDVHQAIKRPVRRRNARPRGYAVPQRLS
jgi:hypothetical protein